MAYVWDFSSVIPFIPVMLKGLWMTVKLSVAVIFFSTIIGTLLGILLNQSKFKKIFLFFIDFFKAIPALILILWFYFLVPELTGLTNLSSFVLVVIALTTSFSAFFSDVVRAGINNIPKEYIDAGRSLGLTKFQTWRFIIMPEVAHNIWPTISGWYVGYLKLTSLASAVSVYELTHAANKVIMLNFRSLETYTVITVMYVAIILPFFYIARKLEKKSKRVIV